MTKQWHEQYKLLGTIYSLSVDGLSLSHVNTIYQGYNDQQSSQMRKHEAGGMWNSVCHSIEEINAALQRFWTNRASVNHRLRIFTTVHFEMNDRYDVVDRRIVFPAKETIIIPVMGQLKLAI